MQQTQQKSWGAGLSTLHLNNVVYITATSSLGQPWGGSGGTFSVNNDAHKQLCSHGHNHQFTVVLVNNCHQALGVQTDACPESWTGPMITAIHCGCLWPLVQLPGGREEKQAACCCPINPDL